jgi:hypothetical protein
MSSQGIPKINELPLSQDFIPGDKIIIDRNNKSYLVDYDNLFVGTNQISFQQDIINDTDQTNNLQQFSTDKYNELVKELTEKSIGRSTAHLIDLTNVTSEGTLSSASYREFITSTDTPFIGPNNLVVFDTALVDRLSLSIDGIETESTECDIDQIVFGQGTISIPKGTYRIRSSISLSPEVNIDLNLNTIDEYIRRKQQVWSYLSFVQLTNPERVILNGSGATTYNNIGQSVTLTLNGYFYTDTTKQYGLKVHTLGKLYPGVVTGTYNQNTASNTISSAEYLSISDLFGRGQFNQSRIIIERVSDSNTLLPLEDSPQSFRSQVLKLQPRVPFIYNAGWLQKINAQDTSVIPASSLLTITTLPFNKIGDKYVGDLRAYITEPKSYQGYVKIGDTIRYRRQQPNSQGIVPDSFSRYDIRDTTLNTPQPGWYGLVVNEAFKAVGDKYDTIFRLDKNGVVSQRQYITDPANFYLRCIAGNTPAPPPAPPIRPSLPPPILPTLPPPAAVAPRGEIFRTGNQGSITQIIPAGVSFIHAVCIGGGAGGYKSKLENSKYSNGSAGDGGSISYKNNIPVIPGDVLELIPGDAGRGTGYSNRGEERRKGGNSELYLRKTTGERILILRARGGGRSIDGISGSITGNGGRGAQNKYIIGGGKAGRQLEENPGGGGGAGGYGGAGGSGGRDTRGETGSNGAGGGGGGGMGKTKNSSARGGRGGGVGVFGRGANGQGGSFGNPSGRDGDAGSGGSNQNFGGGGRSIYYDNSNVDPMDGGTGAVRVIWGTGRSFPSNAK